MPYFSGNYGAAPTTTKRPPKCIDENKNGVCDIDEEKKDEMEEDYDESDEQKADINEVMDYTNQVCRQISGRMGVRFFFLVMEREFSPKI